MLFDVVSELLESKLMVAIGYSNQCLPILFEDNERVKAQVRYDSVLYILYGFLVVADGQKVLDELVSLLASIHNNKQNILQMMRSFFTCILFLFNFILDLLVPSLLSHMTQEYEINIELCTHDIKEFIIVAARNGVPLNMLVQIFPNKAFTNLWTPWIEKQTFAQALIHISNSITRLFSSDLIVSKTNRGVEKYREKELVEYVKNLIVTDIIGYKITDNPQEMIQRVKHLLASWGMSLDYCANLVVLFETSMKNTKKGEEWKKALNELLSLFNKRESTVDYYPFAKKTLNQAIGPTMWMLKKIRMFQALDTLYKKLLSTQREIIISLLNRLNNGDRVITFGKVISDLCEPQNNRNYHQKVRNILILFLIYDNWLRLKENVELKSKIVVLIMSECFGRLMYLLYDCDVKIAKLFLSFLSYSSLESQQIKNKIGYHLIALYKIKRNSKSNLCQLIENIWNKKFMDFRVEQFYINKPPQFIKKSQKIVQNTYQECQTMSSFTPFKDPLVKKKSQNSMTKASRMKLHKKIHWLKVIKEEIKLINIEKLYLLLQGFCFFYTNQYIEPNLIAANKQNDVLGVVIMILQQLPPKLRYRFNPQLLYDSIKREVSTLISKSQTPSKLEQQSAQNLGIFDLCYQDNRLDLESLIKIHLTYNYQQNLSTILCLSMIQEMIHSQNKDLKVEKVKQLLQEKSFQLKLFQLFSIDFQNDIKILVILARLLSLKCESITNNLLVNYAFHLFSKQNKDGFVLTPKIKEFSVLINPQIHQNASEQRVKVLLNMYTIFDNFQLSSQSRTCSNSRKYLFFLRNQIHNSYFYNYYLTYKKYNYIIEAIHFLELHYYRNQNSKPSDNIKLSLLQLYSRININVSEVKPHIVADLGLGSYNIQQTFVGEDFEKALMDIKFQVGRQLKIKNETQVEELPQRSRYKNQPYEKVIPFIDSISELKVSEEIVQKINTFKLLSTCREIHLKYSNGVYNKTDVENLFPLLQKIKNESIQMHFCQFVLDQLQLGTQLDKFQQLYLQLLLKSHNTKKLNKYIDLKIQNRKSQIPAKYHRLMILQSYQGKQLLKALALLRTYQQDHGKLSVQLYRIQLECKYKVMFNFRVQNFFQLFQNCICDLTNEKEVKENFEYYFKIFRMLYQRYNFNKKEHNDIFLRIYKNFLQKNKVLTKNISYLSDCVLYLLRFVLQRFYNYQGMSEFVIKNIFSLVQNNYSCFAPFCDFLLSKLSAFPQKNAIIESLLTNVLASMPNQSIWTYCFLKNFDFKKDQRPSSLNKSQGNSVLLIEKIFKKVQHLQKQNLNFQYLNFVCALTEKCSRNSKQKSLVPQLKNLKVPKNLCYPFDNNFVIQRINYVVMSKNGKSAPLFITFQIKNKHTNILRDAKVIVKYNASLGQNYRIQSNVANFFSQTGLLDNEITYRIAQLTKRLSMLQYVNNCGTVASIVSDVISQYDSVQLYTQEITYSLYKKHNATGGKETRSLQVYDQFAPKIRVQSFQFLISYNRTIKNFRDWWTIYTNFIRTFAQWSYLGYVIGLGDRHNQNILITQKDFQYVLDIGLTLRRPQWVPFRLTNFYTQCLGVLGTRGMVFAEMVAIAKKFKENEANIWKALSVFQGLFETNLTLEIMNRSKFQALNFKQTQSAILWLIDNANSPDLLRQMFAGWNPQL